MSKYMHLDEWCEANPGKVVPRILGLFGEYPPPEDEPFHVVCQFVHEHVVVIWVTDKHINQLRDVSSKQFGESVPQEDLLFALSVVVFSRQQESNRLPEAGSSLFVDGQLMGGMDVRAVMSRVDAMDQLFENLPSLN